jgi:DnaK suppressor protein
MSGFSRIEAALKRIDDGAHGLCQNCDEPINHKRLEFDPMTLRCIDRAIKPDQQYIFLVF